MQGSIVAHELGHLALKVGDMYSDIHGGCGTGPGFDGTGFFRDMPRPTDSASVTDLAHTERNHTLMQHDVQVCRRLGGSRLSPYEEQPEFWEDRACLADQDCTDLGFVAGTFTACPVEPLQTSELSTLANYETVVSDGTSASACPAPQPGRELVLRGTLQPNESTTSPITDLVLAESNSRVLKRSVDAFDAEGDVLGAGTSVHRLRLYYARTAANHWQVVVADDLGDYGGAGTVCGDGVVSGAEECEAGQTIDCGTLSADLQAGTPASCNRCLWDRSVCARVSAATCGNSVLDPGEECDGASLPSCTTLNPGLGGTVGCNASNCTYDRSNCQFQTLRPLAAYDIDFSAGTHNVTSVNGITFDPAAPPADLKVVLGSDTDAAPYGTLASGAPGGQTTATGTFQAPASGGGTRAPVTLRLAFESLHEQAFASQYDPSFIQGSVLAPYVRHDFVNGEDVPQTAICTDPIRCQLQWNSATGRWETAQHTLDYHLGAYQGENAAQRDVRLQRIRDRDPFYTISEWDAMADYLRAEWGILITHPGVDRLDPASKPVAETLSLGDNNCNEPIDFGAVDFDAPAEVVVVLDRSGSMQAEDAQGFISKRLDFAKAGARLFLDLQSARTDPPKMGLVWFSSTPEAKVGSAGALEQLCSRNASSPAVCTGAAGEISATSIASQFLRDSQDPAGEEPLPAGMTDIGAALQLARGLFGATATPRSRAIVFLSDGENNPPDKSSFIDPAAEGQELAAADIKFFAVPSGPEGDRILNAQLASLTGGGMYAAPEAREIPDRFAYSYARLRGESLVVDRSPLAVQWVCPPYCPPGTSCDCTLSRFIDVPVEVGARRLNALVTSNGADDPTFVLRDPTGAQVGAPQGATVRLDRFYQLVSVENPRPGNWRIVPTEQAHNVALTATAHAENDKPDCFISVPGVVTPGSDVTIEAAAYYEREIETGAEFYGEVVGPDGSTTPLAFYSTASAHRATVPAASLPWRGHYEVRVRCEVGSNATYREGEAMQKDLPAVPRGTVQAFTRELSSTFFVDASALAPAPATGDTDGDGISNTDEVSGDTDGDGLPDVYDADGDGDDVNDRFDPDPTNPNVPTPQGLPPVALCQDVLVAADSSCTATVTAAAVDHGSYDPDGPPPVCTLAPTGPFSLGNTPVTLTCLDSAGATASCVAVVTVVDTSAPSISCPVSVNVPCTSASGATATFSVSSADNCGAGAAICTRPSGSLFPIGTTLNTCTVVDASGNPTSCSFYVTVNLGDDPVCCPAGTRLILGDSNNNLLSGTSGSDCILGRGGQDTINGNGGNDFISGGDGDDVISGGAGNDLICGGSGQDRVYGDTGRDVISGADGDDQCYGGDQDDTLLGGQGQDRLYGDNGNDSLVGETGDDRLEGGAGDDQLIGSGLHDLIGSGLHDVCIGGPGIDTFLTCESETQ
jgi:Ca2+-binding RTX toxin-like protein